MFSTLLPGVLILQKSVGCEIQGPRHETQLQVFPHLYNLCSGEFSITVQVGIGEIGTNHDCLSPTTLKRSLCQGPTIFYLGNYKTLRVSLLPTLYILMSLSPQEPRPTSSQTDTACSRPSRRAEFQAISECDILWSVIWRVFYIISPFSLLS